MQINYRAATGRDREIGCAVQVERCGHVRNEPMDLRVRVWRAECHHVGRDAGRSRLLDAIWRVDAHGAGGTRVQIGKLQLEEWLVLMTKFSPIFGSTPQIFV